MRHCFNAIALWCEIKRHALYLFEHCYCYFNNVFFQILGCASKHRRQCATKTAKLTCLQTLLDCSIYIFTKKYEAQTWSIWWYFEAVTVPKVTDGLCRPLPLPPITGAMNEHVGKHLSLDTPACTFLLSLFFLSLSLSLSLALSPLLFCEWSLN